MQVEAELARMSLDEDALLAVGVFDGVHLGHKYLISQLIEESQRKGLQPGVVTFYPNPREVLYPGAEVLYLTTVNEKSDLLRQEGIEVVITLSFTQELAEITARQFITLLKKHQRMKGLVVGPDFAMGRGREGDIDTLRTLGRELDFSLTVIPEVKTNSDVISSTTIRNALMDGNMRQVKKLLGRASNGSSVAISNIQARKPGSNEIITLPPFTVKY